MKTHLPKPVIKGTLSLEEVIGKRRSRRRWLEKKLILQHISQILWAAQGITDPRNRFRAAPSAGATFPLEIYLTVKSDGVENLDKGIYHYNPYGHTLEKIVERDVHEELGSASLDQYWVSSAPINVIITANYDRTTRYYGDRGYRYVHIEVGHVGQNIYLQAEALGLGTVAIGAFYDEEIRKILEIPRKLSPLYIMPVGYPRKPTLLP